jgi:hypothetical protein
MPQTGWYSWHPIRAEKKSRLAVVANAAAGAASCWSSNASRAAARYRFAPDSFSSAASFRLTAAS